MIANACRWVSESIGHAAHWACSGFSAGEDALLFGTILGVLAATALLFGWLGHHHYKHPHEGRKA